MFEKRRHWSCEVAAVSGVPATHPQIEDESWLQVKPLHAVCVMSIAVKWTQAAACHGALVACLTEDMRAGENCHPPGYHSAESAHSVGWQRLHKVQRSPVETRTEAGDTVHDLTLNLFHEDDVVRCDRSTEHTEHWQTGTQALKLF
uniref:Uncharacterized protein n=1 Tax=Ixodes ricinus TaxID=34613 RepID=A0A131Y2R1_IXORI